MVCVHVHIMCLALGPRSCGQLWADPQLPKLILQCQPVPRHCCSFCHPQRGAEVDEHYWWQKYKEEDLTEVAQIYHLYLCTEDPETSPPDSPGTPAPLQFGLSQSGNQSFVPGPESPSRRPATPAQRPPSPVALPSALRDRQPDSGISLHQFKCGMAKGVLPEAFVEEVALQQCTGLAWALAPACV